MEQILLQTSGLTKKYGNFSALSQVSLTLREGDIYGLIGRNGAGKTTFFKCIMGLARATNGEIKMGSGGDNLRAARKQIGFMITPSFFPYLNAEQNLEYHCHIKGIKQKGEVKRVLELVGLYGVKKRFKTFSMGMKQRLGIAGAMLGSPPIVVLDEPINGLDPQGIADIREVVRRENRENGTTFILSSHILSELDLLATQFGFIEQGNLMQEISHTELHEHTKDSLVINVDDGKRAAEILNIKLGVTDMKMNGNQLTLESHFDKPNDIARILVSEGVELYRLSPQETTLEEYFMHLIGGVHHV